jgi:hypothetical protein
MPWVQRHRRRLPGSWFRSTVVRSHYRSSPGRVPILAVVAAIVVIVLLIVLF